MLQTVPAGDRLPGASMNEVNTVRRLLVIDMPTRLEAVPGVPVLARAAVTVGENPYHLGAFGAGAGIALAHSGTACKFSSIFFG